MIGNESMTKAFIDKHFSEFDILCADLGLDDVNVGISDAWPWDSESPSNCKPVHQPTEGYVIYFNWAKLPHERDLRFGLLEAAVWLKFIWQIEKGPIKRKIRQSRTTQDDRRRMYDEANEYAVEAVQRLFGLFQPSELDDWMQQRYIPILAITA